MTKITRNAELGEKVIPFESKCVNNADNVFHINDALMESIQSLEKHVYNKLDYVGIPTGFTDFDDLHLGLRKGELLVLASRPFLGKTTLTLNIVCNVVLRMYLKTGDDRYKSLFFSTFIKKINVADRIVCSEAEVSLRNFTKGIINDKNCDAIWNTCDYLSKSSMFINDTPRPSIDEIEKAARDLYKQKGLDLLVVDGLQFLKPNIKYSNSYDKQLDLSEMALRLKSLARELDIPVIVTATVSARCEDRVVKRPVIADLRDYGKLDEIADTILFLYRENFYNPDSENKHTELIIAKDRFGVPDVVNLFFHEGFLKFVGFSKRES